MFLAVRLLAVKLSMLCCLYKLDVQSVNVHGSRVEYVCSNFFLGMTLPELSYSLNKIESFAPQELASYYDKPGKYLQIDVDTSKSSKVKTGLNVARDQFDSAIYNLAFHIAGSEPAQLPEQLLCAVKVNKIGWKDAQMLNQQYMDYIIEQQGDEYEDDLDAMYPVNMDWLLRYDWSFRLWCVKNLLWSLLDVLALAVSIPGIILRPVTWWRCLNALWRRC